MSNIRLTALAAALYARLRRFAASLRTCRIAAERRPTEQAIKAYRHALETMADEQRVVFLLHVREDLSIVEIANRLLRTSDDIEQFLAQAIAHLCSAMDAPRD